MSRLLTFFASGFRGTYRTTAPETYDVSMIYYQYTTVPPKVYLSLQFCPTKFFTDDLSNMLNHHVDSIAMSSIFYSRDNDSNGDRLHKFGTFLIRRGWISFYFKPGLIRNSD